MVIKGSCTCPAPGVIDERCPSHNSGWADSMKINQSVKDTNPKDSCGIKKVPFSTLAAPVIAEMGLSMLEGALKYGRHNYRVVGVRASVYYDAALRHLSAWWEGESIDPESGLSHVVKAMAGLMVLRDAEIQGKLTDDRPPVSTAWVAELNKKAEALLAKYPYPKPAHTQENTKCKCNWGAMPHPKEIHDNEEFLEDLK